MSEFLFWVQATNTSLPCIKVPKRLRGHLRLLRENACGAVSVPILMTQWLLSF